MSAGAQKEAEQWPVFLLLLKLMFTASLHVQFIGPEVPETMNGDCYSLNCPVKQPCKGSTESAPAAATRQSESKDGAHQHCMQLSFHQGLYHDVQEQLVMKYGKADVVFGANAGGCKLHSTHCAYCEHAQMCLLCHQSLYLQYSVLAWQSPKVVQLYPCVITLGMG